MRSIWQDRLHRCIFIYLWDRNILNAHFQASPAFRAMQHAAVLAVEFQTSSCTSSSGKKDGLSSRVFTKGHHENLPSTHFTHTHTHSVTAVSSDSSKSKGNSVTQAMAAVALNPCCGVTLNPLAGRSGYTRLVALQSWSFIKRHSESAGWLQRLHEVGCIARLVIYEVYKGLRRLLLCVVSNNAFRFHFSTCTQP